MKTILIVCDGLADRPLKRLGGKTPLEVAHRTALDKLASMGICGLMDPISPGVPAGSDTSHLALFGYDPYKYYHGRGAFEALGAGIDVRPGDVSFRGNFATVDEDGVVLDRRAGRLNCGCKELAEALDGLSLDSYPQTHVVVRHTVEHRLAVLLRGPRLSRMVSDTDPGTEGLSLRRVTHLDESYESLRTANIVNELSSTFRRILENHPVNVRRRQEGLLPANVVLLRGAGTLPELEPLTAIYGVRALAIAAGALYRGVAKCVGMDVLDVPGATGDYHTDVIAKAKAAVANLSKYDFVFVHIKAADSASHDGNVDRKIMMIEKVDSLVEYLLGNIDLNEVVMALTADHTSSIELKEHTGDPVPLVICGSVVRKDSVEHFTEVECARGGLGRIRAVELTSILMDLIGKGRKFGE
ncbi:MAG: 2,3-bisphosphoglycerate-independent phosphoglycerate mutase [Candidatus Bathyarchaeia archaeon]